MKQIKKRARAALKAIGAAAFATALGIVGTVEQGGSLSLMWVAGALVVLVSALCIMHIFDA